MPNIGLPGPTLNCFFDGGVRAVSHVEIPGNSNPDVERIARYTDALTNTARYAE